MDAVSSTDLCVLIVDTDLINVVSVSKLLSKANYRVVVAVKGEDALYILQKSQHRVNLVLTAAKLPDICCFEFVKIVEKETRLPVLLMCDTFDECTFLRGLQNGAMLCLVKPLGFDDIESLWQFPIVKRKNVMLESTEPLTTGVPENVPVMHETEERELIPQFNASSVALLARVQPLMHERGCSSQTHRKRKIEELEKIEQGTMQASSFNWTPYVQSRFVEVVQGLGLYNATPSEVVRRVSIPGFTAELAAERLQQFYVYSRQMEASQFEMVVPDATSSTAQQPPHRVNDSYRLVYKDESHSAFAPFLEHQHSREQLKRIVKEAISNWYAEYRGYVNPNTRVFGIKPIDLVPVHSHQPLMQTTSRAVMGTEPRSVTVLPQAAELSPSLVPEFLARGLERFIHSSLSVAFVPRQFRAPFVPRQQGRAPGPMALSEQQGGTDAVNYAVTSDELNADNFDELDTDDIFDAIIELLEVKTGDEFVNSGLTYDELDADEVDAEVVSNAVVEHLG